MYNLPNKLIYKPFLKGSYGVSPGLIPLELDIYSKDPNQRLFQVDEEFEIYRQNKLINRKNKPQEYFLQAKEDPEVLKNINKFIIEHLTSSYPSYFQITEHKDYFSLDCKITQETIKFRSDYNELLESNYYNLLDALAFQVQEDIAICQQNEQTDWLSTLHVSCPTFWSPAEKIGKSFAEVHKPVPGMEKLNLNSRPMVEMGIKKGPFCRFIWELSSDNLLNHAVKNGESLTTEFKTEIEVKDPMYIRVERQTIRGFKEIGAFLFTIRVYNYRLESFQAEEIKLLISSLHSMGTDLRDYKRVLPIFEELIKYLETRA